MKNKELDSNNLKTTIKQVCLDCGIKARRLTQLKRYGEETKLSGAAITCRANQKCDFCGEITDTTSPRNYGYPDFNLLKEKNDM